MHLLLRGAPATPRTQFRLCTVVAEAVANAMVYGNGGDLSRRVIIEVALADHEMVIAVSDEGEGFRHGRSASHRRRLARRHARPGTLPDPPPGGSRRLQRPRKHHLDDAPATLNELHGTLVSLGALTRATLRLWQLDGDRWRLVAGPSDGTAAPHAPRGHRLDAASWLALGSAGLFLEVAPAGGARDDVTAQHLLPIVQHAVDAARMTAALSTELATRYEEIELLYTIGELLGRAGAVEEVAAVILREVTAVVGARRAGLRVFDESRRVLRTVATIGTAPGAVPPDVSVDETEVVVVRAFLSGAVATGVQPAWVPGEVLAVPIRYAAAGAAPRVVGTLALADRAGGGAFTREETRLIAAVATQIGAALENARLVVADRARQRLQDEMQLAHDLQLRLMPAPAVLRGDADVGLHSAPAESVGGDFYTFMRLGRGRVGVMLGDVASHGLAAALIGAEVLAAAGIHANSATPPDETLNLLRGSLAGELEKTGIPDRVLRHPRPDRRATDLLERGTCPCLSRARHRRAGAPRADRPAARPGRSRQVRPPDAAVAVRQGPPRPVH